MKNDIKIAEFMGFEYIEEIKLFQNIKEQIWLEEVFYSSDYNWLMPVVVNIENLKKPITNNVFLKGKFETYEFHIIGKHILIYAHGEVTKEIVNFKASDHKTKFEAIYNACVKFIDYFKN